MTMTPEKRKEILARIEAHEAEQLLKPLDLEHEAIEHEARARALHCWHRHHVHQLTVPQEILDSNRARRREHLEAALRLRERLSVRQ